LRAGCVGEKVIVFFEIISIPEINLGTHILYNYLKFTHKSSIQFLHKSDSVDSQDEEQINTRTFCSTEQT